MKIIDKQEKKEYQIPEDIDSLAQECFGVQDNDTRTFNHIQWDEKYGWSIWYGIDPIKGKHLGGNGNQTLDPTRFSILSETEGYAPQQRVEKWIVDCFGEDTLLNKDERMKRFIEEAIELAQASGLSMADIQKISEYVYSRPAGTVAQEIGGCRVTLYGIGAAFGLDVDEESEREIKRVESLPVEKFRQRNLEKSKAGIGSYTNDSLLTKGGKA